MGTAQFNICLVSARRLCWWGRERSDYVQRYYTEGNKHDSLQAQVMVIFDYGVFQLLYRAFLLPFYIAGFFFIPGLQFFWFHKSDESYEPCVKNRKKTGRSTYHGETGCYLLFLFSTSLKVRGKLTIQISRILVLEAGE